MPAGRSSAVPLEPAGPSHWEELTLLREAGHAPGSHWLQGSAQLHPGKWSSQLAPSDQILGGGEKWPCARREAPPPQANRLGRLGVCLSSLQLRRRSPGVACPLGTVSSVAGHLWVQRVDGSERAITEAVLGLAPRPVLPRVGSGAGVGAMARLAAASLATAPLSCGPAVAPSPGLATWSVCGTHLAPRLSAALQRPGQVGLETTRATVASCAVLEVAGTLTEARAVAGDGIEPPKKCAWLGGSSGEGEENAARCITVRPLGAERRWCPGVGRGQPVLCATPFPGAASPWAPSMQVTCRLPACLPFPEELKTAGESCLIRRPSDHILRLKPKGMRERCQNFSDRSKH